MARSNLEDAVHVRVARPTAALVQLERFYRERIGLVPLASFAGHAGFDGVIFSTSSPGAHFELTQGPRLTTPAAAHSPWQLRWRCEAQALQDPDGHGCGLSDALYRTAGDVVFARTTARLRSVARFYSEELGLVPKEGDGIIEFALPACGGTLRLVADANTSAVSTVEDLVVFYFENAAARQAFLVERFAGAPTIRTHNPWWHDRAICVADPDGYGFAFALA